MKLITWERYPGGLWIRVGRYGQGLTIVNRRHHVPLFSERHGYTRTRRIGRWAVSWLRPVRAISGGQEFDFGGAAADFAAPAGLGQDISSYLPSGGGGFSGMNLSPGTALSTGPFCEMGGGGGGFSFGDLAGYAKQALPFLQLGSQGLGAYTGIQGMLEAGRQNKNLQAAQNTAQGVAAPALAAGQQLIPAGTQALLGGQLPPALESTVNQWMNNWRTQIRQFAARSGIDASTMLAQYEGLIQSQAQELRAQLAQGLLSAGTGALQPAIQGAQVGGQLAGHQQDAVTSAITAANQALARLMGLQ